MRLEDLAIVTRPRTPWEAMDLGIVMTRRWWRAIFLPWILLFWPLAIALSLTLPTDLLWVAGVVLWYLKPLFDRVPLFVLSRAVFGATPDTRTTLAAVPGLLRSSGVLHALTLGRLDPARSFNLPVWQLEGLRGKARRKRLAVLHWKGRGHAVGLTLIWLHLEGMMVLAAHGLLLMMVPPGVEFDVFEALFSPESRWQHHVATGIYVLTVTVMEPLYVAAGFSLYLNRRTELEGWDLELAFRRLEQRAESVTAHRAAALLALCLLPVLWLAAPTSTLRADEPLPRDESGVIDHKALIEEVLAGEEFEQYDTIRLPRYKGAVDDEDEPENDEVPPWLQGFIEGLALIAELLLWLAVAALLLFLWLRRRQLIEMFTRGASSRTKPYRPPEQLFGLQITPESLPDDVVAAARAAWEAGRHREALSLLYRGALAELVGQHRLDVPDSATEGELLALAREPLEAPAYDVLNRLTRAWQQVAYGHRVPERVQVMALLEEWPRHFGPGTVEPGA